MAGCFASNRTDLENSRAQAPGADFLVSSLTAAGLRPVAALLQPPHSEGGIAARTGTISVIPRSTARALRAFYIPVIALRHDDLQKRYPLAMRRHEERKNPQPWATRPRFACELP